MNKTCSKCNQTLDVSCFSKHKTSKDGLRNICKICQSEYNKSFYLNPEKQKQKKISDKIYYETNKEKVSEYKKEWALKNKESINQRYRNYRQNDINYKIKQNLRKRISTVLSGKSKSQTTLSLLGCSLEFFKIYIEQKFKDGMTWDNYGLWHIDHIIPCYSFDLTIPSNQQACFHYTNLQPLWASENCKKNKYPFYT